MKVWKTLALLAAGMIITPIAAWALVESGGYNYFPAIKLTNTTSGANNIITPDNTYIDVSNGAGSVRWRYNTSTGRGEFTGTHAFTGTLAVGALSIPASGGTNITKSFGNSATIDFASRTITCEDSTAITVTGAVAGDACFVGAPTTAAANSAFTCYVSATDAVKVRHCPAGTASDPASATYYVRVFSQQ